MIAAPSPKAHTPPALKVALMGGFVMGKMSLGDDSSSSDNGDKTPDRHQEATSPLKAIHATDHAIALQKDDEGEGTEMDQSSPGKRGRIF